MQKKKTNRTKNNFYYIGLPELQTKMELLSISTKKDPAAVPAIYENFAKEFEQALVIVQNEQVKLQAHFAH